MAGYKPWYAQPGNFAAPQRAQGINPSTGPGPLSKLKQAALNKALTYGLKAGLGAAGLGPLANFAFNKGGQVPMYAQAGAQVDYTALANAANALIDQQNLADHNQLRALHATQPGLFGNTGNFAAPDRSQEIASNRQGVLQPGVLGGQVNPDRDHASAGNYQQQNRGNLNYLNEQAANNAALKEKASGYKFFNEGGDVHGNTKDVHAEGHDKHLLKADLDAPNKMMKNFGGRVGPLSSVKYKKVGGKITHETEMKYHNPLQQKSSSGDK